MAVVETLMVGEGDISGPVVVIIPAVTVVAVLVMAVVAALRGTRPINRSGFDPGDPNQEGASGGDQQVQRRRPRRR